jgi:sugar phosphate isomerase/epimerase
MTPRTGFVTQLELSLKDQLALAGDADFDYVEILADGHRAPGALAADRDEVTDRLDRHGLDLVVHLPFPTDIGSPHEAVRAGAVETQTQALETAAALGAEKAVLHPESSAWEGAWDDEEVRHYVDRSVDSLVETGDNHGVEVCAENLFENVYTLKTMDRLLERTDVSMTLDTGHARVTGHDATETAAFVAEHAARVSHVHLNDTRRPRDEHLPFGAGTIDFETVLAAFPADWDGTLSLEVGTDSLRYLRQSKRVLDEHLAAVADSRGDAD